MVISSNPRLEKEDVSLSVKDSSKNHSESLDMDFSSKTRYGVKIMFSNQISLVNNLSLIVTTRYSAPPFAVNSSETFDISQCENITTTQFNFNSSTLPGATVAAICGGVAAFVTLIIVLSCVISKRVKKDSDASSGKRSLHGEGTVGNQIYENVNSMEMTNPNEKKTGNNTNGRSFSSAIDEIKKKTENPDYENLRNNSIEDSKK